MIVKVKIETISFDDLILTLKKIIRPNDFIAQLKATPNEIDLEDESLVGSITNTSFAGNGRAFKWEFHGIIESFIGYHILTLDFTFTLGAYFGLFGSGIALLASVLMMVFYNDNPYLLSSGPVICGISGYGVYQFFAVDDIKSILKVFELAFPGNWTYLNSNGDLG